VPPFFERCQQGSPAAIALKSLLGISKLRDSSCWNPGGAHSDPLKAAISQVLLQNLDELSQMNDSAGNAVSKFRNLGVFTEVPHQKY